MKKSEKIKLMAEKVSAAEELVKSYVDKYNEGIIVPTMKVTLVENGKKVKRDIPIKPEIDKYVGEYNLMAREVCYEEIFSSKEPLLEAVKRLTFTGIKFVEKINKKDNTMSCGVSNVEIPINLLDLHNRNKIGIDYTWSNCTEVLNQELAAKAVNDLTKNKKLLPSKLKEVRDSYRMSEIARKLQTPDGDILTDKTLLERLQKLTNQMIGENYKVMPQDLNFIKETLLKKGKGASVKCPTQISFVYNISAMLHSIVTGVDYEVIYNKINKTKAA